MMRPLSRTVAVPTLLTAAVALGAFACSEKRAPARPNVLVLLLDTTRADHLGALGYERDTSPNIDRLARENLLYTRAYTEAPWTPPSVATLFSGLWASSHGMMPSAGTDTAMQRLDEHVLTLAEILKSAGYKTAGISANPWISPEFGYDQGFDSYAVKHKEAADVITDAGLAKLDELRAGGAPFFLYLHYLDPHRPYSLPKEYEPYKGQLKSARFTPPMLKFVNTYDAEIRYLDASLGRLFAQLKAKGLYDDLVIVLVSDHGEQFGEHGYSGHGWTLYDEELHVPLIVKPGRIEKGRSSDRVVSMIDVLPTLLTLVDVAKPPGLPGLNLLDDAALAARRGVFAEVECRFSLRAFLNAAGKKLIVGTLNDRERFDPVDPLRHVEGVFDTAGPERKPIEDPALRRELEQDFTDVLKQVNAARITPSSDRVVPSEEMLKRLSGLGYVK
jgi:arylsulfatase A-like enzyme